MDINQTYCGDHFTIYTNIKSLYYTPETNIILYANYTSIKNKTEYRPMEQNREPRNKPLYVQSIDF